MARIAIEVERALARRAMDGSPGRTAARLLAQGDGWSVADVVCTWGPDDRPFEEQHGHVSIAIVAAGSFQYRSAAGRELLTPGSLLLGNAGQCFECGHEHGAGDRCVAFWYEPEYIERLAADAGASGTTDFRLLRVPPLRTISPLVTRACATVARDSSRDAEGAAGVLNSANMRWEELGIGLAAQTVQLVRGLVARDAPPGAAARVARIARTIERHPDTELTLGSLAREAGLSPYHFLRTFERVTGVTPHQYVLRARLREAAIRLTLEPEKVLDIALDCGFGDVSNFNRAFRAEFGASPRAYRRRLASADVDIRR
jgi:AraC family transcriptional regulator